MSFKEWSSKHGAPAKVKPLDEKAKEGPSADQPLAPTSKSPAQATPVRK